MSTRSNGNRPGEFDWLHENRAGLSHVQYRLGRQPDFLAQILKSLPGSQSATVTRPADPDAGAGGNRLGPIAAVADAWAMVGDVLALYQEMIANEGFLGTAAERQSVLELVRSIGYELNPGVASGTVMTFQVEENAGQSTVPAGTRILSIPGQNERPQTFETQRPLLARSDWNELRPLTLARQAQVVFGAEELVLQGTATGLGTGDMLLIVGPEREDDPGSERWDARLVSLVTPDVKAGRTNVKLAAKLGSATPRVDPTSRPKVYAMRAKGNLFGHNAAQWSSLSRQARLDAVGDEPTPALAVAVLQGGRSVWVGGGNDVLTLLDFVDRNAPQQFTGHVGRVRAVAAQEEPPAGSSTPWLGVSGGDDGVTRLWNLRTRRELKTFEFGVGRHSVNCVALSPDGKWILTGHSDGRARIWNVDAEKQVDVFGDHKGGVTCCAILPPEGNTPLRYLIGGADHKLALWTYDGTPPDARLLAEFRGHTGAVTGVAYSAESKRIASCSEDRTVRIFDPAAPSAEGPVMKGHLDAVRQVGFLPGGLTVVSTGMDRSVRVWRLGLGNSSTATLLRAYTGHTAPVRAMAVAASGMALVTGDDQGAVRLWNPSAPDSDAAQLATLHLPTRMEIPKEWPNFAIQDEQIDLDGAYPRLAEGSWVVLEKPSYRELYRAMKLTTVNRSDYGLSGRVTRIVPDAREHLSWFGLRTCVAHVQSEELALADVRRPLDPALQGDVVTLDRFVPLLEADQLLVFSGKPMRIRVAAPGGAMLAAANGSWQLALHAGDVLTVLAPPTTMAPDETEWQLRDREGRDGIVRASTGDLAWLAADPAAESLSEAIAIASVQIASFAGEERLTSIWLKRPLSRCYDRTTVTLCANAVPATHGETVTSEVLGHGDGNLRHQRFLLRKSPLTFTAAATPSGGASTLEVRVNGVKWREAASFVSVSAHEPVFLARNDDQQRTAVIFGDGIAGSRLPSGVENVTATYRIGIGPEGEIPAHRIVLPQVKPLGVRSVTNPLPASGSAPPEPGDSGRTRAPLTVVTLDRVVSLADVEMFARTFAGVGKAQVADLIRKERRLVHLTVGTRAGEPMARGTQLYNALAEALDAVRDPAQTVQIDGFQRLEFAVKAAVTVAPEYEIAPLLERATQRLLERFSFLHRDFGQPVTDSDVLSELHQEPGVVAVDLDVLDLFGESSASQGMLHARLEAARARWGESTVLPAQQLVLHPMGVTLSGVYP